MSPYIFYALVALCVAFAGLCMLALTLLCLSPFVVIGAVVSFAIVTWLFTEERVTTVFAVLIPFAIAVCCFVAVGVLAMILVGLFCTWILASAYIAGGMASVLTVVGISTGSIVTLMGSAATFVIAVLSLIVSVICIALFIRELYRLTHWCLNKLFGSDDDTIAATPATA